ncbi:hypothetical protein P153DRAFT_200690 [Dothidotthia symphoricarpi CBS 119687]|uniref:Uncharacterized protein n=1 Tax=Dothidotthia symphoricarpi CBS 119687 TaxID=1392245 RepID=A0A6A6AL58_9PLEO|nr:uncharacterized protein P153DRAFT_200690 [Dothidotthia symphoricarpi CBS 119687]KAF2131664.1 hypothetical protein P153DRAFT_200690 [Dothidotthia symphoricarpi CBS 119687]
MKLTNQCAPHVGYGPIDVIQDRALHGRCPLHLLGEGPHIASTTFYTFLYLPGHCLLMGAPFHRCRRRKYSLVAAAIQD